jgi:hypothetical protein
MALIDNRIESGMADLALEVLSGGAREGDIRRLAMMVLARKRTKEIKPATIIEWLTERRFKNVVTTLQADEFRTMELAGYESWVDIPMNQASYWYASGVCLAAADVALVLGKTADHWLAEWFGIELKAAKEESLRETNAEQDKANALEIALR